MPSFVVFRRAVSFFSEPDMLDDKLPPTMVVMPSVAFEAMLGFSIQGLLLC